MMPPMTIIVVSNTPRRRTYSALLGLGTVIA
jgi:hypothetical protein